ncbi:MAG: NUDIX domain-containing protein [bacterium]|nr:NUDIX domain-containing protein [bacterium]
MREKPGPDFAPAVPIPAATVILVRDAIEGVEVFLMERSGFGVFGGLHVFPGGKIDPTDGDALWSGLAEGVDPSTANATLGVDAGGLDYWVACIRECFEEAGVLLATREDGTLLPLTDPVRRARFATWRERLNGGEKGAFEAMCQAEGLRLAADRLAYVSHWITPIEQPKRFNTRFFVARAPAEQEALHDGFETVESHWIRPEVALDRWQQGELNLISPTFTNLEALTGFDSTQAVLEAKRAVDPATIPVILPKVTPREGGDFDEEIAVVGRGGRAFDDAD